MEDKDRPVYARMSPAEILEWIYKNANYEDTVEMITFLKRIANQIADRKGLR